jgi:hypothetical protein
MNILLSRLCVILFLIQAGCVPHARVSYEQDVVPIFENKCLPCHLPPDGRGYVESGLDMNSYASIIEGTAYGRVVVPGDSRHSILNMLVEERVDDSIRTPHPLTTEEIETLRLWVDQGANNN